MSLKKASFRSFIFLSVLTITHLAITHPGTVHGNFPTDHPNVNNVQYAWTLLTSSGNPYLGDRPGLTPQTTHSVPVNYLYPYTLLLTGGTFTDESNTLGLPPEVRAMATRAARESFVMGIIEANEDALEPYLPREPAVSMADMKLNVSEFLSNPDDWEESVKNQFRNEFRTLYPNGSLITANDYYQMVKAQVLDFIFAAVNLPASAADDLPPPTTTTTL